MKKLLTYETFVPKNIEKRAIDKQKIDAKQRADFNLFLEEYKKNVVAIQGLQVTDADEQNFIDSYQGVTVVNTKASYGANANPFNIKVDNTCIYNWKDDVLYHILNTYKIFDTATMLEYIKDMYEKYFKFRPSSVL